MSKSTSMYFQDDAGYHYRSGWVSADDGLLVIDADGDGAISANEEVSFVEYVNGKLGEDKALAAYDANDDGTLTDLEALSYFDSNADGALNADDAEFSKFLVWQDLDGDGKAEAKETKGLSAFGIEEIGLSYNADDDGEAEDVSGNTIHGVADYRYRDAEGALQKGAAGDVSFAVDGRAGVRTNADGHREYLIDGEKYTLYSGEGSVTDLVIDFSSDTYKEYAGATGGSGNDTLTALGLSGNFTLSGGAGADTLIGGAGHDWLIGGAGADVLRGGAGHDVLITDASDTEIDGGAGYDYVIVDAGGDDAAGLTLYLSEMAVEMLSSGEGDDTLYAGGKTDAVTRGAYAGRYGAIIYGNGGDDTITGAGGNDILTGDAGADTLKGGGGDDILSGGAGADTLHGDAGDDLIIADAEDTVVGGAGYDTLVFTDDVAHTVDLDSLQVETVIGGGGNDSFYVGSAYNKAHLWLYGGGGDDSLQTGTGSDYLHGGAGSDTLQGSYGDDLYVFERGDGHDTISDHIIYKGREYDAGESDTLSLSGDIALGDLVFRLKGGSLEIGIKAKGGALVSDNAGFDALSDRVTIKDWGNSKRRIENLSLSDGTYINLPSWVSAYSLGGALPVNLSSAMSSGVTDAAEGSEIIKGGAEGEYLSALREGAQSVYGEGGDDVVYGGMSGDTLRGDFGDGIYWLSADAGGDAAAGVRGSADIAVYEVSKYLFFLGKFACRVPRHINAKKLLIFLDN